MRVAEHQRQIDQGFLASLQEADFLRIQVCAVSVVIPVLYSLYQLGQGSDGVFVVLGLAGCLLNGLHDGGLRCNVRGPQRKVDRIRPRAGLQVCKGRFPEILHSSCGFHDHTSSFRFSRMTGSSCMTGAGSIS